LYTTSPDSISLAICVFIHVKQYTIEKYAIAVSTPTQEGYTKPWRVVEAVQRKSNECNDLGIVELGGIGFYRHEIGCVQVV
jgi:hypothetical protein